MRIVLHIGFGKTGTTSLQNALAASRGALRQAGVLYPSTAGASAHGPLALMLALESPPRFLVQAGPTDPDALVARADAFLAQIEAEAAAVRPDTLVLSSEYLVGPHPPERVARLMGRLKAMADTIEVVCYLRDPVGHFLAFTAQWLRACHVLPPVKPPDLATALGIWAAEAPVTIRVYDRARLVDGDVVADFARHFLPPGTALTRAPDLNQTLSAEGVTLLWSYRSTVHPDAPHQFRADSDQLYRELLKVEDEVPGRTPLAALPAVAAALRHAFEPQAEALERLFGLRLSPPPDMPFVPLPEERPLSPTEVFVVDPDRQAMLQGRLLRRLLDRPPAPA